MSESTCMFPAKPACDDKPFYRGICFRHHAALKDQIGEGKQYADWNAVQAKGLCGGTDAPACPSMTHEAKRKRSHKHYALQVAKKGKVVRPRTPRLAKGAHPVVFNLDDALANLKSATDQVIACVTAVVEKSFDASRKLDLAREALQ